MATRNSSRQHDLRFLYGRSQERPSESGRVSRLDSPVTAIKSEYTTSSTVTKLKDSPDNSLYTEEKLIKKHSDITKEPPISESTPVSTSTLIAPTKPTMAANAGQSINVNDPTLIALVNKLQDVFTTVGVCLVSHVRMNIKLTSHRSKIP